MVVAEANKAVPITEATTFEESLFTTKTGEKFTVMTLSASARGGWGRTKTDEDSKKWTAPGGYKIASYEAKVTAQKGDYTREANLTSDHTIEAKVWCKGHPRGDADNESYITMDIVVYLEKR